MEILQDRSVEDLPRKVSFSSPQFVGDSSWLRIIPHDDGGQRQYNEIVDPKFRGFLEQFDKLLEESERKWPMRIKKFRQYPYPEALRLRTTDMKSLLVDVRRRGVMDYLTVHSSLNFKPSSQFDKDRCLAFAALSWIIARRYAGNGNRPVNITDSRENFPWAEIAAGAKAALGLHHLSALLYTDQEPQPGKGGERTDKEPVKIKIKFPELKPDDLKSLEEIDIRYLDELLTRLPREVDDVNPAHHQVPVYVLKSVMFILSAAEHRLAAYNPDEDSYSLVGFHRGVETSLRYLIKNVKNIKNLGQLLRIIKRVVAQDPQ